MAELKVGDRAPSFELEGVGGSRYRLEEMLGKGPIVLLFYPGDFTPVCTKEMCSFRDALPSFNGLSATVLGISTDAVASHEKFSQAHKIPFPLLADPGKEACEAYGVIGLLGRAKRASFVIDRNGIIRYAKVQLPIFRPSVEEIEAAVRSLSAAGGA